MPNLDNTPGVIIADAMFEAGLLGEGDSPTSDQQTRYLRKLRDLVRWEQTQGLKLFLNVNTQVPLVYAQGTYTLGPGGDVSMDKPKRVISAFYLDAHGIRRPLVPLSWDEHNRLSQINQPGVINSYFVDKQATLLKVSFWLIPDATTITGSVYLLLQVAITAPVDLTTETSFPDEWRMYLVWAMADQLSTGQPQSVIERCQGKAEAYRITLEDWDVEDASTQFQPDSRLQYIMNNFR